MHHISVCVNTRYGRAGIVLSGPDESKLLNWADSMPNKIGYCGNADFAEAVRRAGMMERDEPGAWGVLSPPEEAHELRRIVRARLQLIQDGRL